MRQQGYRTGVPGLQADGGIATALSEPCDNCGDDVDDSDSDGIDIARYQEVIRDGTNDQGGRVPSGIHVYRLQTGDFTRFRKMVPLK